MWHRRYKSDCGVDGERGGVAGGLLEGVVAVIGGEAGTVDGIRAGVAGCGGGAGEGERTSYSGRLRIAIDEAGDCSRENGIAAPVGAIRGVSGVSQRCRIDSQRRGVAEGLLQCVVAIGGEAGAINRVGAGVAGCGG